MTHIKCFMMSWSILVINLTHLCSTEINVWLELMSVSILVVKGLKLISSSSLRVNVNHGHASLFIMLC